MTFALILLMSFWPGNVQPEKWNCTNPLEIQCDSESCTTEIEDSFTPMSVSFDDSGSMSVCAYTGCWEGKGKVFQDGSFLVLSGIDFSFSTAKDRGSSGEDILIAFDRSDQVALLKAGSFSHPMLCKK